MNRLCVTLALLAIGLCVRPASAQTVAQHGTVAAVSGETVRVELADTLTVELGTEGLVIQERTIAGRVRQIRIVLLEVVRIEQALDGPWVAVGRITRSELAPAVGDAVEFTSVQPRQATLVIQSNPEGATAYIDGTQVRHHAYPDQGDAGLS